MFKIEAANRIGLTKNTPTDLPCQWNQNFTKNVLGSPVSEINIYGEKAKQKLCHPRKIYDVDVTENDRMEFLERLSSLTDSTPVCLHLFHQFDKGFQQKQEEIVRKLPPSLRSFYSADISTDDQIPLLCQQKKDLLKISADDIVYVEEATRAQSASQTWYDQRAGRITGSVLGQVYKACGKENSPPSLISKICSPSKLNLKVPAIEWGKEKKKVAFLFYQDINLDKHVDSVCLTEVILHDGFEVNDIGFCIDTETQWLGASPDGAINCECCGYGVLEIKCPYSLKDSSLDVAIRSGDFYVCRDNSGKLILSKDHQYYFQVQLEMKVTQTQYCDFVVWTPEEFMILRIEPDINFIETVVGAVSIFWDRHILPELVTRKIERSDKKTPKVAPKDNKLYCSCKRPYDSDEEMVGCDKCNNWYHPSCLKLKKLPSSKIWYCYECRKKK